MMLGNIIRVNNRETNTICDGLVLADNGSGVLSIAFFAANKTISTFADLLKERCLILRVGDLGFSKGHWKIVKKLNNLETLPTVLKTVRRGFFGDVNICQYDQRGTLLGEERVASVPDNFPDDDVCGYEAAENILLDFFVH